MEYAVESRNLTKCFGSCKAVDNLELKVPHGSIYGFLGPNGAGKTTTIKMLTGLSRPTSGDIRICGRSVSFGSLKNRMDIGYLPDVPCFYDWMNAEAFLRFSGELFSLEKKVLTERMEYLLQLVGLQGVKKRIGGYSRGMKQRLGIAQALINDPKVVFLDEPTSALDPIGRKEVMDIIAQLAGKVTVFFSTHILSDVERVCDRVVILNKGKVVLEDEIARLRERYAAHSISLELEWGVEKLMQSLQGQEWLDEAIVEETGEVRLHVRNMKEAQLRIPVIIAENKLAMRKFAFIEPTLEDIFLKAVKQP
jgi:ABC-2 type transport system ATP-binding protein